MFTPALFILAKIWKQPKCPSTDEWIKKIHTHTHTHTYIQVHTHTHMYTMEYYLAIKNKILPFTATWMNLEGIMLCESEMSQTEKDKYYMISLICGI